MKKVLLVLSVALIGLTSCQKEEDAPVPVAPTPVVTTPVATQNIVFVEYVAGSLNVYAYLYDSALDPLTINNNNSVLATNCSAVSPENFDFTSGETYRLIYFEGSTKIYDANVSISSSGVLTQTNITTSLATLTYDPNCNSSVKTLIINK